jgi:tetratricopeptide (TPR) repeat protein
MPSLIPGYEYDIFISYRQKDNKYDGWVTEFVENLQKELEATFKEEINVYFDINPHDGLLETYDVDESLKDKLKCLIFIPIISRTYIDPKSFAWEHEFKAFIKQASNDQYGLKVKLPNGNVSSRVLPVQIHDLKADDKALIEKELRGFLRSIEFVYTEPGVNRPLTDRDSQDKNINKTNYRNQINKVANAIDEIIAALKTGQFKLGDNKTIKFSEEVKTNVRKVVKQKPAELPHKKIMSGIALVVILVIAAIIAYPKIFKRDTLEKLRSSGERISVAVMPFQNMTNDTIWNVWQVGIQNELITSLTNSEELKVRQIESILSITQSKGLTNYASITPSIAKTISQKLDVNVYIYGNINKAGSTIRLNANLIDTKTEEVFKSFQVEGPQREDRIFYLIDSLSTMVKNFLLIAEFEKEVSADYNTKKFATTNSPEVYRYYINGENTFKKSDFNTASDWYLQTISIDSNFTDAYVMLAFVYQYQGQYDQAKKWSLRLHRRREILPVYQKIYSDWCYTHFFETPYEEIKCLEQLRELDDQIPFIYYLLGVNYRKLQLYDKAIPYYEKALEIYKEWGVKPWWIYYYTDLGRMYHKTGQFRKEKKLYIKAEKDFLDDPDLINRKAVLSLVEGDVNSANIYIEKYTSILKNNLASYADVATNLALIYEDANLQNKAEESYREALDIEPNNPSRLYNLSWFLIDKDRNIQEGLELIEKAWKLNIDEYYYDDCMGYGLLKLGKYKEALEFLKKSDSLKPVYNHDIFLHLEEARNAVANQKNN